MRYKKRKKSKNTNGKETSAALEHFRLKVVYFRVAYQLLFTKSPILNLHFKSTNVIAELHVGP